MSKERTTAEIADRDQQELIDAPSFGALTEEGNSISCSQDSYDFDIQLPGSTRRSFIDELLAAREQLRLM